MTKTMTATELKAKILAVLDDVAAGDEVEVTKHGRPVARIVPITNPKALIGRHAGLVTSSEDDEELFTTGVAWNAS